MDRNGERLQVPVTPSQSGDGTGRVGIQLASNSKVLRKKAGDPLMVRRRGAAPGLRPRSWSALYGTRLGCAAGLPGPAQLSWSHTWQLTIQSYHPCRLSSLPPRRL